MAPSHARVVLKRGSIGRPLSFADKVLKILGEKRGVIIPSDEYEKKAFYGGGTNFSQIKKVKSRLISVVGQFEKGEFYE